MKDLFFSEFKRYQKLMWGLAALHVVLWAFASKLMPTMAFHPVKQLFLLVIASIGGIVFGLVSTGLHQRKNHWTYLVHRPLDTSKIHLALAAANLLTLFTVICLPIVLVFGFLDVATTNVVDSRHYLTIAHLFAIATSSYFIASYAMSSPAKASFLALWVILLVVGGIALPLWQIALIDISFILLSAFLSHRSFRINKQHLIEDKCFALGTVVMLQPVLLLLLVMSGGLYYHIPLFITGNHPNKDHDLNSYQNYITKERDQGFAQLLAKASHPAKASLIRQVSMSEYHFVRGSVFNLPRHQQLVVNEPKLRYSLPEPGGENHWVFSHNDMVFVGSNLQTGNIVGYFGKTGFFDNLSELTAADKFDQVVVPVDEKFLQSKDTIYTINFSARTVSVHHQLPAGEYYTKTVKNFFDRSVLQSNKATYIFEFVDFYYGKETIQPEHVVAHPNELSVYQEVFFTEVQDGFVIRYVDKHYHGYLQPGAALIYVEHNGDISTLVDFKFTEKHFPDLMSYQAFIFSPWFLNLVNGLVPSQLYYSSEPYRPYQYFWQREVPAGIWLAILFTSLLAMAGTLWLGRRLEWSRATITFWLSVTAVLSVPGFVAVLLLHVKPLFANKKQSSKKCSKTIEAVSTKEHAHV